MLWNIRLDHLSVGLSVRKVYCGKTADRIRMPFGVLSGVGRGMGVLDGSGDRRRRRGSFGVNLRRPIVTNWAFATRLFSNYFEDLFSVVESWCTAVDHCRCDYVVRATLIGSLVDASTAGGCRDSNEQMIVSRATLTCVAFTCSGGVVVMASPSPVASSPALR